jgi:DNA-binding NarL/FixJ family response regulator
MSFFKYLLQALGFSPAPVTRQFSLDEDLSEALYDLAAQESRPVNEIANVLIQQALEDHHSTTATLHMWNQITPRQKQVAALLCLGYTNQEIALRLSISPETVKSHVRAILRRYDLHSRTELSRFFGNWDFSEWDR